METRGRAILDKIFTNIADWYRPNSPVILPEIGQSDHRAVLMQPTGTGQRYSVQLRTKLFRSCDQNGKVLLEHALRNVNCSVMYRMNSGEDMVNFFYETLMNLINCYLPVHEVVENANDKPWVTERFRRVIRCRQYALTHGRFDDYRRYRNMAIAYVWLANCVNAIMMQN